MIRKLSRISEINKIGMSQSYTRIFKSMSWSTSAFVWGGNFGRNNPSVLPTPSYSMK